MLTVQSFQTDNHDNFCLWDCFDFICILKYNMCLIIVIDIFVKRLATHFYRFCPLI